VQHAILFGEYELTIDDKKRLLIPAEVRKAIDPERDGKAFFLVIGKNRRIWLYPEKNYQNIVMQSAPSILPDDDALAFDQMHFAMAQRVEWDKPGRLVVPEKLMRRTNTGTAVTLIGVRDHLEIWNRTDWEERFEALQAKHGEIALKASSRQPPPGTDRPNA
jgi:MraZ protein